MVVPVDTCREGVLKRLDCGGAVSFFCTKGLEIRMTARNDYFCGLPEVSSSYVEECADQAIVTVHARAVQDDPNASPSYERKSREPLCVHIISAQMKKRLPGGYDDAIMRQKRLLHS